MHVEPSVVVPSTRQVMGFPSYRRDIALRK
jgi:hypothetical protein